MSQTVSLYKKIASNDFSGNPYVEVYEVDGKHAFRKMLIDDQETISQIEIAPNIPQSHDAQSVFDYSFLRMKANPQVNFSDEVTAVDLFSGCGCLSLGALEACTAIGKKFSPILAQRLISPA